jgi:murein DD-endopeptidase MepM/ murein hydrolase activator NlpD
MNVIRNGIITTGFEEMRPLNLPPEKRWHIHGALDLAGGDGIIRAPARGTAQGVVIFRSPGGAWGAPGIDEKSEILEFPWRDYWYDIYGGIIVLYEPKGRMHILAHIWASQILNPQPHPAQFPFRYAYYIEERETTRYPCHMMLTETVEVKDGQPLARVGNAGQSTGPHVHWEIHHQATKLDDYPLRINPEEYL